MGNEDKLIISKKVNLASPKAGAEIIDVSDDFFAKCDAPRNVDNRYYETSRQSETMRAAHAMIFV